MRIKESITLALTAFEMPEGCYSCPFCVMAGSKYRYCALRAHESNDNTAYFNPSTQRAPYCPLIELKFTAKDDLMNRTELIEAIKTAFDNMS